MYMCFLHSESQFPYFLFHTLLSLSLPIHCSCSLFCLIGILFLFTSSTSRSQNHQSPEIDFCFEQIYRIIWRAHDLNCRKYGSRAIRQIMYNTLTSINKYTDFIAAAATATATDAAFIIMCKYHLGISAHIQWIEPKRIITISSNNNQY